MLCSGVAVCAQVNFDNIYIPQSVDTTTEHKISIDFRISSAEIDSTYSDNAVNLRRLHDLIREVSENDCMRLDSIHVSGLSSPDGTLESNRRLSLRRAISLRDYLLNDCAIPDSVLHFGPTIVAWEQFRDILANSSYAWKDDALRIINRGDSNNSVDHNRRMNRLKRLAGGSAWRTLCQEVFPKLRTSYIVTAIIEIERPAPTPNMEELVPTNTVAPTDSLVVVEEVVEEIAVPDTAASDTSIEVHPEESFKPQLAFKTDLAYLALTVANLGAEFAWGKHWSVDLPLVFSPYTVARDWRMRFYVIQPELRYWLKRPLKGHFFGVHLHTGYYNISFDKDNRYQDDELFFGAGLSYGYAVNFNRHWGMEFTLGVGYLHTKYDVYYNVHNGAMYRENVPYNYFGITKLGINLVYRFDIGGKGVKR